MTKRNLLLVGLFLVFGLATMAPTALAQTQWVGSYATLTGGRAEGLAEETGVYTFTYYGTGSVASLQYFTVTYNAPIVAGSAYLVCTGTPPSPFQLSSCAGVTATILSPVIVGGNFVSQAVKVTFTLPLDFALNTYSNMTLTVRVNATKVTCNHNVTAAGHAYKVGNTNYTLALTTQDIAFDVLYVNCSPNLSLTFAAKDKKVGGANGLAGQVLSCIGTKDLGPYDNSFCLNVDEEFAGALTSASYEYESDPDATNGTDFTITLTDVPEALTIKSPTVTPCGDFDHHDPNFCKQGTWTPPHGPWVPTYIPTLAVTAGDVSCTDDAGSSPPTKTCTITFTVDTEDNGNPENMDICFTYKSRGPLPTGYVEIYANVAKGPTTAGSIPLFDGSSELKEPLSVVDFSDCMTTLLYPYVANYSSGWDTGIEVSNTTLDPFNTPQPPNPLNLQPTFGKGSAVPQNGPCTFYLFANGAFSPTQPWVAYYTTDTIKAGDIRAFGMQEAFGTAGVNIRGYVIAVCDFQNAHGDAMFTYNFGLDTGLAGNYLADVLPNPAFYHRTPAGDMLGETAIAPYLLNKQLMKLLSFGSTGCCGFIH